MLWNYVILKEHFYFLKGAKFLEHITSNLQIVEQNLFSFIVLQKVLWFCYKIERFWFMAANLNFLRQSSKLTSTNYVYYLGLDKRNAFAINKAIFYLDC